MGFLGLGGGRSGRWGRQYNHGMSDYDAGQFDDLDPVAIQADGLETVETAIEADEDGLKHVRIDIRRALPDRRIDK